MSSFRASAVLLAAATLVSINGCDTSAGKADKQVQQNINTAVAQINGSDDQRAKAESLLQSSAQSTDASPASRMDVQELRAQLELRDAQALQPKIDKQQADIQRLIWEIHELASQIQASNDLAAALSQYDPAAIQTALTNSLSQVKGSPDHPQWIKTETGGVPSLAAVTASISTLQTQINDLQAALKSLTDQRAELLTKSDQLNQDAEKAKGDKAVDLFKQGADARKQSEELSVQIDEQNVKLARAQADMAVASGQEKILTAAIQDMTGKADQSAGVWKTIQQHIEEQKTQAKSLLGDSSQASAAVNPDDPTGGSTLVSKAAALNQKMIAERTLRQDAETHLNSAIEFFKDAGQLAATQQTKLQTRINEIRSATPPPEAEAWKDEAITMHPARYQLQQASALDRRAILAAARAADAAAVQALALALKPTLDSLQESLPASLADNDNKLATDVQTGRQLADASYDAANELLKNVDGGTAPEDQRRAARIASIFTQYGWYLLSSSVGDKAAADHLTEAKAQRDAVVQNGLELKSLPPELAITTPAAPPK